METGVPDISLTVTCPDGTTYSNSTDAGLLSCDPGGLATAEGFSSGDSEGRFEITLFPTAFALTLFDCRR